MSGRSLRIQREKLWKQNPRCENCKVLTVLPEDVPSASRDTEGRLVIKKVPDNMATIQHKYFRLHPKRQENKTKHAKRERRHFLWCYKCNFLYNERNEKPKK